MSMKRVISIVLILTLAVLTQNICEKVDAKTHYINLNYSYYKMTGGYTVKLKNRSGIKVKWKSTNKSIATVTQQGKVKGHKKGKCYIIAKRGRMVDKCRITVTSNEYIPNKKFTKTSLNVLGLRIDINNIEYDELGRSVIVKKKNTFPLSLKNNSKKIVWQSTNKKIAIVSKKGVVKPVSPGKTYIVAKANKKKYKCKVIVTNLKNPCKIENQNDAYEMLRRINNLRIKKKAKPLKIKDSLMKASNKRATEIKPKKIKVNGLGIKLDNNFTHSRPNGKSFSTIFNEFNLPRGNQMGENICFVTDTVRQRNEFLNTCFKSFLNSKYHYKNMIDKDYDYIGIGHDDSIHFTNYHTHPCIAMFWVQLFYTK